MGNGQSTGTSNSSSHSFLSNKKSVTKTKGKVIVVRKGTSAGGQSSSQNDDLIKRFLEIPKFYPILKGALNQPGLRDPPETIFKISARPLLKFAYRLQEHLSKCANIVVAEQESLGSAIKDVDHDIAILLVRFGERRKALDQFQNNLEKISDLQAHISNLRFLFHDLMPIAETLNEILPEQKRLPMLNIGDLVDGTKDSPDTGHIEVIRTTGSETYSVDNSQANLRIEPADELAVVDKSNA